MADLEHPDHPDHPDHLRHLHHLRTESQRFRDVLATCDPAARVPACPDWDAGDLLWHLAEVQWFWAGVIRTRPLAPQDNGLEPPARPSSYAELLEAFDDFSGALLTELERADPTEAAWHWSPVQTVATSHRRQAHEALIHRLDAEQTAGVVTALDPLLAADGVLEVLDVMYGGEAPAWGRVERGPHHVAVELSDVGRTIWTTPAMFFGTDPESGRTYDGPHLLVVGDPGHPADAVVRGAAGDLDAWLWHRRDSTGIEQTGDADALAALRAAVSEPLT